MRTAARGAVSRWQRSPQANEGGLKVELKISSPSKVTQQLGLFTGQASRVVCGPASPVPHGQPQGKSRRFAFASR